MKKWVAVFAAVVIVVIVSVYFYANQKSEPETVTAEATEAPTEVPTEAPTEAPTETPPGRPTAQPTPTRELKIDIHAGDLVTPTPAPTLPGVAIPGWKKMKIPAGVTDVATSMPNPEANADWYYLTFEMRMADTGEVLFTTDLIPPGQYCNGVTLTRPLEAGVYEVIVHVQPYTIDGLQPTNSADLQSTLTVE